MLLESQRFGSGWICERREEARRKEEALDPRGKPTENVIERASVKWQRTLKIMHSKWG